MMRREHWKYMGVKVWGGLRCYMYEHKDHFSKTTIQISVPVHVFWE